MPTWPKLIAASLLVAGSVIAPACRREPGSQARMPHGSGRTIVEKEPPKPRGMPRALPLPARPTFAMHVANPGVALAALGSFTGLGNEPGAVLRGLTQQLPAVLGPEIHDRLDPDRPWSAAIVENQVVIRVAVRRAAVAGVERTLAAKPKVGSFGAVELLRPAEAVDLDPPPPQLAWLDSGSATLTLAGDERGLATGRELGAAYGKHGLFITIDGAQIRKAVPEFPFDRVELVGKDVGDFHITTEGNRPVEGIDDITEGALTGVLAFPELAAGATSRYAKHDAVVKGMISDASRMVEKQNFLVRGVLEDMLKRYKAVLRSWNGRVMGGVGAKGHVLLALGADDPKKASGAATSLIDAVMDNLDLARTFGVSVPKLRFKRNQSIAAGVSIHVLALANARKQVPPELAGLLNGDGDLRVAFGGSEHLGSVMVAIGPDSPAVLTRWIEATKTAAPGHKTRDHMLAAAVAVDADALPGLRTGEIDMRTVLGLVPDRAPTNIVATRKDGNFDIHITGPIPKVAERRAPRMHPSDPRMRAGAVPPRVAPPRAAR